MSRSLARIPWLTGRSVALHLGLLLVLPMCAIAAWWQVDRALSGNALSWLYVFEWPAFSGLAVWLWWVLLTSGPSEGRPEGLHNGSDALLSARSAALRWDTAAETAPLRAYNKYLAELAEGRETSRPRCTREWSLWRDRTIEEARRP